MEYTYNQYLFHDWSTISVEYYLLGRAGIFMSLSRVAVHNLHHSLEMVLKAGIIKKKTSKLDDQTFVKELKYDFAHDLKKLWEEFKKSYPLSSPEKYDLFISQVDEWDKIRYSKGQATGLHIVFGQNENYFKDQSQIPEHITNVLDMNTFDKLIHLLWSIIESEPKDDLERIIYFSPQCFDVYNKQNNHALKLKPPQPKPSGVLVASLDGDNQSGPIPPTPLIPN